MCQSGDPAYNSRMVPAHDPVRTRDESRPQSAIGMWLFLAALTMLFASSMLGYAFIRTRPQHAGSAIHLPVALWLSTVLVLGVSAALAAAQSYFRQQRRHACRQALIVALALAAGFVTVQTPALVSLLLAHRTAMPTGVHIYGLIFFLILLHALHVIGGIVGLTRLTLWSQAGHFELSNPLPIRNAVLYWHFLDLVWLVMFTMFLVLG